MMSAEGLDSRQWQRGVIDLSLKTADGKIIDYVGDGLISSFAQGHAIDFAFKTSSTSITTIEIPLFVSCTAAAQISVNGQLAATAELRASEEPVPLLHRLTADVTKWAEGSVKSVIRLLVSYKREHGVVTILSDPERQAYSPRIIQHRTGATVLKPTLFFVMAWGCVLACAILIIAHIRPLSDTFRFYATLTVAASWMASVLGLPDLAKIPLRGLVRRAYANTQGRRFSALSFLTCLFLFTGAGAAAVVYCLVIRYSYTRLISDSLQDAGNPESASIKRAFVLLPWRKEAQLLFERHTYKLRTEAGMRGLRTYVRGFVKDSTVKAAVMKAASNGHMLLPLEEHVNQRWFSDPVVWYAGLLPEAEADSDTVLTSEAVQLLTRDTSAAAYLLRMSLQLSLRLRQDDRKAIRDIQRELASFLSSDSGGILPTTFEYEFATDALAVSYVRGCDAADASYWFQQELEARRRRRSDEGDEIFHRPPHKLLLYHMFVSYSGVEESNADVAARVLDFTDGSSKCKPFRETFRKDFLQRVEYAEYKNPAAWLQHTILDTNLELLTSTSLLLGWRY